MASYPEHDYTYGYIPVYYNADRQEWGSVLQPELTIYPNDHMYIGPEDLIDDKPDNTGLHGIRFYPYAYDLMEQVFNQTIPTPENVFKIRIDWLSRLPVKIYGTDKWGVEVTNNLETVNPVAKSGLSIFDILLDFVIEEQSAAKADGETEDKFS